MATEQTITSRLEGLEESRAALERIIRAQRGAVGPALRLIGEQWVTETQRRAPLLTGRLRRSYTYQVGTGAGFTYVEVSSNVEYAPYQEFGTRRIAGTPHLRPAAEAVAKAAPKLIAEGLGRAAMGAGGLGGAGRLAGAVSRLGALGG